MANSLFCSSKLWDSASPLIGFAVLAENNVMAIDQHSLLHWNRKLKSLTKCVVHNHDLKTTPNIGMFAVEERNLIIIIFSVMDDTGGFIEVWSDALKKIQRVS